MQTKNILSFEGIREWNDEFLALFPHRFDYIWAEHASLDHSVQWRTESRHPLSDRLIQQGAYLYGVRFGAETNYGVLDIDTGSIYHPQQDSFAISRISAALEPLGLVSHVACTSSYSGGLHLYFPFQQAQSSWQLAIAITCLLENAGFKLKPGQLEVFPNPKPYTTDKTFSLFNAHRLPLQAGSYLLNKAWQPVWSNPQTFVRQWQLAQHHNDVDCKVLKKILKCAKRKIFGVSGKAEKFINDLNAEIELGWTGYGQTNRLLGRITMRAYIFHHVISGEKPLQGEDLVNKIVETAQALPGYKEWCRHQHEIEHRAREWTRCIENSHYFHFGDPNQKLQLKTQSAELSVAVNQAPTWNQRQSAATRDRIKQAIADLLEKDNLPAKPTARFHALLNYGLGGGSLYRHRDLWHPNYFDFDHDFLDHDFVQKQDHQTIHHHQVNSQVKLSRSANQLLDDDQLELSSDLSISVKTFSNQVTEMGNHLDVQPTQPNRLSFTSLFPPDAGNTLSGKAFGDRPLLNSPSIDSNAAILGGLASSALGDLPDEPQGVQLVQQADQAQRDAVQEAFQAKSHCVRPEGVEQRQIERMQQYLASNDPILMAEAIAWAQVNPGVLSVNPLQMPLLIDYLHIFGTG